MSRSMWPTATTRSSAAQRKLLRWAKHRRSNRGRAFIAPKEKAPPACAGGVWKTPRSLERKLRRQLNTTWRAATQEGVADAHVAGGSNLITSVADFTVAVDVKTAWSSPAGLYVSRRIGNERRKHRIRKVRMVQDIEKVRAQLQ